MDLAAIMLCVATTMGVSSVEPPPVVMMQKGNVARGAYFSGTVFVTEMDTELLAHEFSHHLGAKQPQAMRVGKWCARKFPRS